MNYENGSNHLNNEYDDIYSEKIVQIINERLNRKFKNIYFNIQNDEIIIRNIKNIKSRKPKEIIQLIKYEIGNYMPLDLKNYVIKYKKIINMNGSKSIQAILFPNKYVNICNHISEKLKIKKRFLYINFDILQKLMDLRRINLSQSCYDNGTIIENRDNYIIINTIFNRKIIESYVVDKSNSKYSVNEIGCNENIYYFGKSDEFIKNLQIKKLDIKDKLILNNNQDIIDMTLVYLPALGMII